jgi:hypothetical protein
MALTANKSLRVEKWTYHDFTLTSGQVAYKNGLAVVNTAAATGNVLAGAEATTMVVLGVFDEYVDASLAAKTVRINFLTERTVVWFKNDGVGTAVAATDLGKICYIKDDETVSMTATTRSAAGVVLAVSATKGVAVDIDPKGGYGLATAPTISNFTNATHTHASAATGGTLTNPIISGFTSANHTHRDQAGGGAIGMQSAGAISFTGVTCSMTAAAWSHYAVPATGTQASKIVVAATGTRGDLITFTADGTNNTQTVTYYSGTYAKTAALTASTPHAVMGVFDGTNWQFISAEQVA